MRRRGVAALLAVALGVTAAIVARSPGHAAGLNVDPDLITVQVIANPPP